MGKGRVIIIMNDIAHKIIKKLIKKSEYNKAVYIPLTGFFYFLYIVYYIHLPDT